MPCQRAPQARGPSLCLDTAVSSLSLSMDGVIKAGKVFLSMPLHQTQDLKIGESTCLSFSPVYPDSHHPLISKQTDPN